MIKLAHILAVLVSVSSVLAQDGGLPAMRSLQRLRERFGAAKFTRIVEMTGTAGDPQPYEWRVKAYDPTDPSRPHDYWIGERRSTDEGVDDDYYTEKLPKGYFDARRLRFDSIAAFDLAEATAKTARVGFDSINYRLHCREYSTEPVWTLSLLDKKERIVGSLHVSGESGQVFRTVWIRLSREGERIVQDSAIDGRPTLVPKEKPAPTELSGQGDEEDAPEEKEEKEDAMSEDERPPLERKNYGARSLNDEDEATTEDEAARKKEATEPAEDKPTTERPIDRPIDRPAPPRTMPTDPKKPAPFSPEAPSPTEAPRPAPKDDGEVPQIRPITPGQ
jgi:hypothetical protein